MTTKEKVTEAIASTLVIDDELYPRTSVNSTHVAAMVAALEAGHTFPPIVIEKDTLIIVDGVHRRAAHLRAHGEDAVVTVQIMDFSGDRGALFEAALRFNSSHGQNFSSYDKARAVARGEALGMTREQIAGALNMTRDRLESFHRQRVANGKPVKHTLHHLAGDASLTPEQVKANDRAGGMSQVFYINQVTNLLENNAVDGSRSHVREAVVRLSNALAAYLG
tara:strand:+ start:5234 stop:5899 length:666 start_codon:yes stop_codon:yes gene_type:complete